MAIKFSQFITQTSASSLSHIVGYNGADNIQITPADFFTSFATGTTGFIPTWTSSSNLGDSILEVNSALPNDVLMPQYIRHSGDTNTYFGFYSNDTIVAATSGNEVMRITSAGNVGIGTSSPASKLDVVGGVTAQGTLVATGISQLGSGGANVYLTSSSAGNVGIGTSSPGNKLEVAGGGVRASYFTSIGGRSFKMDNVAFVGGYSDGSGANGANDLGSATNQWKDLYLSGDITSSAGGATFAGNVVVNSSNSTGVNLKVGGEPGNGIKTQYIFSGSGQRNWQIGMASHLSQTLSITPSTANGNTTFTTPILNLDGSDNSSTFAGSIFLPDNRDVGWNGGYSAGKPTLAAVGTTMKMFPSGSVSGAQFTLTPTTATFAGDVNLADSKKIQLGASQDLKLYHDGSHSYIQDSGTGVLKILSSGVTFQNEAGSLNTLVLDSSGNATFAGDVIMSKAAGPTLNMNTNTSGNTSKILLHEGTTSSPANGASIRYDGSANTFKIGVGSNVDTTRLTITRDTGNVGIGTTSPASNFEISDSTQATGATLSITNAHSGSWASGDKIGSIDFRIDDASTTEPVRAKIHTEGLTTGTYPSSSQLVFSTANANTLSERMRINSSGNVGIGTGADIYGDLHLEGGQQDIVLTNTSADGVAGLTIARIIGQARGYGNNGAAMQSIDFVTNSTTWYKGDIVFKTNNSDGTDPSIAATERMRIDSSGNVGIGTTSPFGATTNRIAFSVNGTNDVTLNIGTGGIQRGYMYSDGTQTRIATVGAIPLTLGTNDNERMRIDSSGNVLFGTTGTPNGTSVYGSGFIVASNSRRYLNMATSSTALNALVYFFNPNGVVGYIATNGSATVYNTSSDYRLKEDLQDFSGLDMVSKIPVYDFKWKADESRSYGVMAHELEEVLPQAVAGEKDGEEMQGVDYSKIVPLLIKSIQELKAEVEDLKSKI